jgi:catechol 1,2-dioxygenase
MEPEMTTAANARVTAIFDDVHAALTEILTKHQVTWDEFRTAIGWLADAGKSDYEIPLLLEVFLSVTVDNLTHGAAEGTECNVEGPFFVEGAPDLTTPYILPRRSEEPGRKLIFSGTVTSTDGTPLAGATLDLWQANGVGEYSNFHPNVPPFNLRGRITTDAGGRFEVETIEPSGYPIPEGGATGRLVEALGRSTRRPAHLHVKVSHPDVLELTTQLYLSHDPDLRNDVVEAMKESLIIELLDAADGSATCSYDFVLPRR